MHDQSDGSMSCVKKKDMHLFIKVVDKLSDILCPKQTTVCCVQLGIRLSNASNTKQTVHRCQRLSLWGWVGFGRLNLDCRPSYRSSTCYVAGHRWLQALDLPQSANCVWLACPPENWSACFHSEVTPTESGKRSRIQAVDLRWLIYSLVSVIANGLC